MEKSQEKHQNTPSGINPDLDLKRHSPLLQGDLDPLFEKLLKGDRYALSKAITLVESNRKSDQKLAGKLLDKCLSIHSKAKRIAVSGAPGAGKSSFLEVMGLYLVSKGLKLAILAVDPSSELSHGSILADKTRMPELSNHPGSFIRPTASASYLGGIAKSTKESILLCEAAGYDVIFVETVGVGQSEIAVTHMVDMLLLLVQPGSGDNIQGIKRGIMELADIIAINKADKDKLQQAKVTKAEYAQALKLLLPKADFWKTKVVLCSALEKTGIQEIWTNIENWYDKAPESWLVAKRIEQNQQWFLRLLEEQFKNYFYQQDHISSRVEKLSRQLKQEKLSLSSALYKISKQLHID